MSRIEAGAVGHGHAQVTLEVALLHRRQALVEDHARARRVAAPWRLDLVGLARADEQRRIGRPAPLPSIRPTGSSPAEAASSASSSRLRRRSPALPEVDPDQDGPGGGVLGDDSTASVCKGKRPALAPWQRAGRAQALLAGSLAWKFTAAAGHDGGDGVLVDHLRHGVAQQHDVLVEGFDVTLQLDAVDQVDGDRDVFLAQQVEERVLQELAFVAHDMLRD
jgi:hypothetical protein